MLREVVDLAGVKKYAERFVETGGSALLSALNLLEVPSTPRPAIFERWLHLDAPPIAGFAPYASFVAHHRRRCAGSSADRLSRRPDPKIVTTMMKIISSSGAPMVITDSTRYQGGSI